MQAPRWADLKDSDGEAVEHSADSVLAEPPYLVLQQLETETAEALDALEIDELQTQQSQLSEMQALEHATAVQQLSGSSQCQPGFVLPRRVSKAADHHLEISLPSWDCASCKAGQACETHCPCRLSEMPCKLHMRCPMRWCAKFQCSHLGNCTRRHCKFCHCIERLQ